MTCGHCASAIARAIASVDKAARLEVDIAARLVRVDSAATPGELVEAITDAGYTAEAVQAGAPAVREARQGCCCGSPKAAAA